MASLPKLVQAVPAAFSREFARLWSLVNRADEAAAPKNPRRPAHPETFSEQREPVGKSA